MLLSACHLPLLNLDIIKRCKTTGILTVRDFLSFDKETLSQVLSIPFKDISSIRSLLLNTYSAFPQSGENIYKEELQSTSILSTGCNHFDELLDGGIYTGEITGVHGRAGVGKTQLCLSIISSVMIESDNTYLYLDTNGGFTATRLRQILLKKTNNLKLVDQKLKLLRVVHIHDVYKLLDVSHCIREGLITQDQFFVNLKLVVLDSITPLFASTLNERNSDGQVLFSIAVQQMGALCVEHAISVLVCNNMVKSGLSVKPALDRYWRCIPSVVLYIEKSTEDGFNSSRNISLAKSCRKATFGKVTVAITDSGISLGSND